MQLTHSVKLTRQPLVGCKRTVLLNGAPWKPSSRKGVSNSTSFFVRFSTFSQKFLKADFSFCLRSLSACKQLYNKTFINSVSSCDYCPLLIFFANSLEPDQAGPSPCIQKWSGGGSHRVPKSREGGEYERGIITLSLGGSGGLPRENFEFWALLCAYLMGGFMRLGPNFSRFGH